MRSIERHLLVWILGALTAGSLLLAFVVYLVTLDEMTEVFDVDLRNVAEAVASYHAAGLSPYGSTRTDPSSKVAPTDDSGIVTSTWSTVGERLYASSAAAKVPLAAKAGLSHLHVEEDEWIAYDVATPGGWAQAAQRVSTRRAMAAESAAKTIPPMAALVLIVGALLAVGLRRGLRPLDAAAQGVAARNAESLTPLSTADMPSELEPMVSAINGLIGRLAVAFATQRRFLADAAHELRTPVTALRLQLQLLEGSTDEGERRDAMDELRAGIDRSQHLIEQFLVVSSAESGADMRPKVTLDLGELARSVVGALSVKAEHRGIDLGAEIVPGVEIQGHRDQLVTLLTNLIENALRYSPSGSIVDVRVDLEQSRPVLRVVDDGPGIPEADRERVFDRFYRGEDAARLSRDDSGSGLGLAIVRAIAEGHDAFVSLRTPAGGRGLEVHVVFGRRARFSAAGAPRRES